MTKEMWDEQFGNSKWAYLADETQREHYDKIIDLYLQHAAGRTILDIGCGEGLLYRYFSDRIELGPDQYTGIDISEVAVRHFVRFIIHHFKMPVGISIFSMRHCHF